MKAILTPQEVELVWTYADSIEGKDPNAIRQDFLESEIHKEDYDKNSPYGWCAEYVVSPQELSQLGLNTQNVLCDANIRVLHLGNFTANTNHLKGRYRKKYREEDGRLQQHWHISEITDYGISELEKGLGLNEEQIKEMFPYK